MISNGTHHRRARRLLGAAAAALALTLTPSAVALATTPSLVAMSVPDPPPAEPGDSAEPAEPADDPDDTAEPSDAEPSDATEPTGAAEPSDSAEPSDTAEPGDTPQPGDAREPAEPGDTGEPGDTADPAEPTTDAMPAITVEGNQIIRDGQPWWFLGYNSFVWSGDCGNDDEKMTTEDVDTWFAGMRHDGHGAVRLFFYDGWDIDRLDAAVASAQEHNIYLTITLDDAIGGCGENDKDAGWFDNQSERDTFQSHMEMLLERYKGDTTFAWFEYFNEPDYEDGALRAFYDEMGAVADDIDPDRLFSSGTVAPYWVDGEDNFRDIHESPGVDIASMHEYDEGEVESNHGPGVRANSGSKPVIVGEYGITAGGDCDSGYDGRADRFAAKAEAYTDTAEGYAGALAWAWQPGGGGCELGNLDSDEPTQDVLREFGAS